MVLRIQRAALVVMSLITLSACAALIGLEDTTTVNEPPERSDGGPPTLTDASSNDSAPSDSPALGPPCDNKGGLLVARFKLDEGKGTIVHDCTENRFQGNINSAEWVSGRPDAKQGALDFKNGWITVGHRNDPNLLIDGNLTLTAWVRLDGFTGSTQYVVGKTAIGDAQPTEGWRMAIDKDRTLSLSLGTGAIFEPQGTRPPITAKTWTHIAASFKAGASVILYVNGEAKFTHTTNVPKTTKIADDDVQIGARGDGSFALNGALYDVRIYKTSLTASEIQAIMNE